MGNDIYADIDGLAVENIGRLAERLETRAGIGDFGAMRDRYFDAMALSDDARILELGGGTGIVGRAYVRRPGFHGRYVVSDLSTNLIEFAAGKAQEDGLSDLMDFQVGNAVSGDGIEGADFDAVIMHTLVSHVPDPKAALATAMRFTRRGGVIAVFDADYQSLRIHSGNQAVDELAQAARARTGAAQPTVMRWLPAWASELGLKRQEVQSHFLAEVGDSEFFVGIARAVAPAIVSRGEMTQTQVDDWLAAIDQAIENDSFFGMCPYFTYLYRKV